MPRRRDVFALVLIVLPWTILLSIWHQGPVTPQPVVRKEGVETPKHGLPLKDCVLYPAVKSERVYGHHPPWTDLFPTIYVITPTYTRAVQKAELTRLANTLLHVPNLHWIVVEDSPRRTGLVSKLLKSSGLNHTHLNVETPRSYRTHKPARGMKVPRGTAQRNQGLRWLRETISPRAGHRGVVYFADDDNTYSLQLFEEMRSTKKVSVWPVAFVGGLRYESPKINNLGKVHGWRTVFDPHRPFAIDMAGFAINLQLILNKRQAYFKLNGVKGGYQESSLLRELVTLNDLEPKADNCTKSLSHRLLSKPLLQPGRRLLRRIHPSIFASTSISQWGHCCGCRWIVTIRLFSFKPGRLCLGAPGWKILVWHTRTERPVLVNEGKKGFTDFNVEI